MPVVTGTIHRIRYFNHETAFGIATLEDPDENIIAIKGTMPGLREGMGARAEGEYETDPKWGRQLRLTSFTETRPVDTRGMVAYLSNRYIKNIGPVLAKEIVKTFGADTYDVLDNHPERLKEVYGIGKKRIETIIEGVRLSRHNREIMMWLSSYGITPGLSQKIYDRYQERSIAVLEENPYVLANDIKGIAFKKADEVAKKLGIAPDAPFRILSGIKACLETAATEGHTYLEQETLIQRASSDEFLDIDPDAVRGAVTSEEFIQVGVTEDEKVFLPLYYHAERKIARRLQLIYQNACSEPDGEPDYAYIEGKTGIHYSDWQKEAVLLAVQSPILIVTGGPGTGKTTTTNAIITECERRGLSVLLAAPTGRAAKRMSESCHHEAKTIHRLLEYSQGSFQRNESNPINTDVVIIDESSMIDTLLMMDFLKAVSNGTKVIFVGDENQLPSVGAGSVLHDLIKCRLFPVHRLNVIYRQAEGSRIITNAHRVNMGKMPNLSNTHDTDFWFFRIQERDKVSDEIVNIVANKIQKKFGYGKDDIQVLCPMRRDGDPIGSTVLNARLQQALNPDGMKAASRGDTEFRYGDRVMQTKNNYDKDVFNGDIGTVSACLSGEGEDGAVMEVTFDGKAVRYRQGDLTEIELAYACTIHKSQGSEYPVVIMPVHTSHFIMLKRNLLYTGITRAKKQCILVGTEKAIAMAVSTEDTKRRLTNLAACIEEVFEENTLW